MTLVGLLLLLAFVAAVLSFVPRFEIALKVAVLLLAVAGIVAVGGKGGIW